MPWEPWRCVPSAEAAPHGGGEGRASHSLSTNILHRHRLDEPREGGSCSEPMLSWPWTASPGACGPATAPGTEPPRWPGLSPRAWKGVGTPAQHSPPAARGLSPFCTSFLIPSLHPVSSHAPPCPHVPPPPAPRPLSREAGCAQASNPPNMSSTYNCSPVTTRPPEALLTQPVPFPAPNGPACGGDSVTPCEGGNE